MRTSARAAAAVAMIAVACAQLTPATASADPETDPQTDTELQPAPGHDLLHNITYRARVDGVSRGATITYAAEGNQIQTATPTMVPGRIFEVQTVLPISEVANMRVSVKWPYSANLHCEILVDDMLVAQADDFVAPRFLPQNNDPEFGSLTCEVPVAGVPGTEVPGTEVPGTEIPGTVPAPDPNLPPA